MGKKISGELIGTFGGLRIYGRISKAKKRGKDRLWIHVRQDDPKEWRIAATLSYANSLDIRFENDKANVSESTDAFGKQPRDPHLEPINE